MLKYIYICTHGNPISLALVLTLYPNFFFLHSAIFFILYFDITLPEEILNTFFLGEEVGEMISNNPWCLNYFILCVPEKKSRRTCQLSFNTSLFNPQ